MFSKKREGPEIPLVTNANGEYRSYSFESNESSSSKVRQQSIMRKKHANVGYRLAQRKNLFTQRRRISDVTLCLALFGIALMVIENELAFEDMSRKSSVASQALKICITASTLFLMFFLAWYHKVDLKLYMIDNGLDDFRLSLTFTRVTQFTVEVIACLIHPFPMEAYMHWTVKDTVSNKSRIVNVPVDLVFSLPMFLRLYLIGRSLLLHSKLFTDASSRSLGALNQTKFTFKFVFKSYMDMHPTMVLTVITLIGVTVASWCMRACEIYDNGQFSSFFNSLWLILITFLTVGYGDIVPHSVCGRGISVLTGIFGVGCTALVVAVMASKLEMSRAEKYVHTFVIDIELDKKLKHAAANILREGWLVFKLKKRGETNNATVRYHQRRFLEAIRDTRKIKTARRRMEDSSITLTEMSKTQAGVYDTLRDVHSRWGVLENRVEGIESKVTSIDEKLTELCRLVHITTK